MQGIGTLHRVGYLLGDLAVLGRLVLLAQGLKGLGQQEVPLGVGRIQGKGLAQDTHRFRGRALLQMQVGQDMQDRRVLSADEGQIIRFAREQAEKAFERQDIRDYLDTDEDFWMSWKY